jgi:hypothetical protein
VRKRRAVLYPAKIETIGWHHGLYLLATPLTRFQDRRPADGTTNLAGTLLRAKNWAVYGYRGRKRISLVLASLHCSVMAPRRAARAGIGLMNNRRRP